MVSHIIKINICVIFLLVSCKTITENTRKTIYTWDNDQLNIDIDFSYTDEMGHAHVPLIPHIPAKNHKYKIKIQNINNMIIWESGKFVKAHEIPIIVQKHQNKVYIVCFIGKSEKNPAYFSFYMNDFTSWKQIDKKNFPKCLAIQNINFINNDEVQTKQLEINNTVFQASFTAALWRYMSGSNEIFKEEVKILLDYKTKYITK
jgi:hypothetical protein